MNQNPNENENQTDPQKQVESKVKTERSAVSRGEHRRSGHRGGRGTAGFGGLKEMGTEEVDRLKEMGGEQLENLKEMGNDFSRRVTEEVQERPFVALGVAFGAGVLMSTLLTSRIGRLALLAGGGYVAKQLLGDRFEDADDEDLELEQGAARQTQR